MLSRMNEVESRLDDQCKHHETVLAVVKAQLDKSRNQICLQLDFIQSAVHQQESRTQMILFYAKSTLGAVKCLQQMVGQMFQTVLSLHDLASQGLYMRSLDPAKGLPVTLEDALGNIRENPLDWISSWEVCLYIPWIRFIVTDALAGITQSHSP